MIHYVPAEPTDLTEIMTIENQGFSDAEAATSASMAERIKEIADTFIVAKNDHDRILGYIVGPASDQRYITDDLFEHIHPNREHDKYQTVLSLAVDDDAQHQGIASQLLTELAKVSQTQKRQAITLTCLEHLVPFYERNGYKNEGISASAHAGETWYNLVREL